jgi:hypothetical protein
VFLFPKHPLYSRLAEVTRRFVVQPAARDLGMGYFGSSIRGGAALVAAAEFGQRIDVVSLARRTARSRG